ncbi:MAG TPA: histidine kinase [Pyrinomonadaceae bacterium]|jgi:sensor histidine kinase YesM|nr:histidine kinase [Pyrinomonadaceae bacterium]
MAVLIERRRRRVGPLIIFGCWSLFGLFFATQRYIERAYGGNPTTWGKLLAAWGANAYLWAALTPLVLWLASRFPIERPRRLRPLLIHLSAGILIAIIHLGIYLLLLQLFLGDATHSFSSLLSFKLTIVAELHFNFLLYWAIVGISHALDYYRQKQERELKAAQLETRLARAQLDALRLQLHPHFLFNTLNTISVLMLRDVKAANAMLLRLSELLRVLIRKSERHEVTLGQELAFLKSYLEIEQTRFNDRLTVRLNVDPSALGARVPVLILQPIVENAIRHGIAPRAAAGLIEISAERFDAAVRLQVRDNGPGLQKDSDIESASRIGLSNTRTRLEQMYGAKHSFDLRNSDEGGLVVSITLPFCSAEDSDLEMNGAGNAKDSSPDR